MVTGRWEKSGDGSNWEPDFDLTCTGDSFIDAWMRRIPRRPRHERDGSGTHWTATARVR